MRRDTSPHRCQSVQKVFSPDFPVVPQLREVMACMSFKWPPRRCWWGPCSADRPHQWSSSRGELYWLSDWRPLVAADRQLGYNRGPWSIPHQPHSSLVIGSLFPEKKSGLKREKSVHGQTRPILRATALRIGRACSWTDLSRVKSRGSNVFQRASIDCMWRRTLHFLSQISASYPTWYSAYGGVIPTVNVYAPGFVMKVLSRNKITNSGHWWFFMRKLRWTFCPSLKLFCDIAAFNNKYNYWIFVGFYLRCFPLMDNKAQYVWHLFIISL